VTPHEFLTIREKIKVVPGGSDLAKQMDAAAEEVAREGRKA